MNDEKCVDIIIPVYNALNDLKKCLESIEKYTDLDKNKVIIINDNSSDPEVKPFLDLLDCRKFIIYHNKNNKGFSANVNKGMSQSENKDVILLNSDTIVTKNWIDKILNCAYSSEAIGTVTPLSNNATLCSVPLFCCENFLPAYLNVDEAAEIVEKCSMKKYPRITVAHGFCMFIKREVINKVGKFDSETFQKGYGEENDFCNRAGQMGYIHVMCDDTYIYHSGTKSFVSKEKEKLIREHEKILYDRYPIQMRQNEWYCQKNPDGYVAENVGLYFELKNRKKNVLYMLHSDFRNGKENNVGGTQFHVRDLKNGLSKEYNVFVVARNMQYLTVTGYVNQKEFEFDFYIGMADDYMLDTSRQIRKALNIILDAFSIDLVHVHHVISLSLDIFSLAKEKKIPVIFTAHDFYFICPTIKLLGKEGTLCCENIDSTECQACLAGVTGISERVPYISCWRERMEKYLEGCTRILFPSESSKAIFLKIYPKLQSRFEVIEHGVISQEKIVLKNEKVRNDLSWKVDITKGKTEYLVKGIAKAEEFDIGAESICLKVESENEKKIEYIPVSISDINHGDKVELQFTSVIPLKKGENKAKLSVALCNSETIYVSSQKAMELVIPQLRKKYDLRVAFIGGLDITKGSGIVHDIIKNGSDRIQWFTFGTIGDVNLQNLKKENYTAIGSYRLQDLKKMIALYKIDLIGILSIWPETYSYTLSEAIINQIPVIVTNIGALGERIDKYKCGYKVSTKNAAVEFLKHTEDLLHDESLLLNLRDQIKQVHLCSKNEMVEQYKKLYEDILNKSPEKIWTGSFDKEEIYKAYHSNSSLPGEVVVPKDKQTLLMREAKDYEVLKTTLTYQIIMRIINMKVPGKKQLMDFIYKILKRA